MAQILDPVPPDNQNHLLCCYVNATSHIQIARISNIPNWYFERVVFPGQRLVFEAMAQALLEIHTGMMASAILSDTIPCDRLCVEDSGNSASKAESLPKSAAEANVTKPSIGTVSSKIRLTTESLTLATLG
ncbi:MAG: DUF1830 domain-containing protein [Symplocastrum torsivum CPER-KK1]|jgi:hypothetical protein|uniref:DUF1830 domain-containing protein n=1 Tax=Symplocastrum torsivum CPER-KK1 TaxID=450513 RepID=A0A951U8T9_9CYAN|nr:DUF1830 domain-containing protein [Symplocastrum torsivum CPER-KK1]